MSRLKKKINNYRKAVDKALEKYINFKKIKPRMLADAMHYTAFSGGKRFRPVLTLLVSDVLNKDHSIVLPAACAIELVHNFSLIHDDLPCMDNDDYRRGRLTNHKVFNEPIALLAGDALLAYAFKIMSQYIKDERVNKDDILKAIEELASSTGYSGMIGGQVLDITVKGDDLTRASLQLIHAYKTGALIRASARIGAILLGLDKIKLESLTRYAQDIGLVYQIVDDILDKDSKEESSFLKLYGLAEAKKIAGKFTQKAVKELEVFGKDADILKELAVYLLERKK